MDHKDPKGLAVADALSDHRQGQESRAGASTAHKDMASTSRRTPSRSTSPRLTRSATTPVISTSQNLSASPLPSREVSPIRPSQPAPKYSTARVSRSRKNSTEQSPQRTPSHTPTTTQSVPSAAAVQRALAAVGDKKLPSPTASQFSADTLEPRKTARGSNSGPQTQARLTSPPSISRLKSPTTRTPEQQQPSINANIAASKPASAIETIQEEDDNDSSAADARFPARGGGGSKLETVQEDSPVQTPAMSDSLLAMQRPSTIQEDPDEDNPEMTSSQTTAGTKSSATTAEIGSGSDEATGKKNKGKEQAKAKEPDKPSETPTPNTKPSSSTATASRKPSVTQLTPKPPAIQPRRSFQHLNPARNKEGSVKSMTVETETVSNPDLIGDRDGRSANGRLDGGGGSVRAKASTETIRPKREKKRVRKAPNLANGTASSKADIFEAKVASAVDEAANSSDSEETFVYESNPPEPRSSHRNQHRYHHSRTPSAASMASQSTDNYRSNHFGISGKKSMKFVNANQLRDPDDEDAAYYPSNTARSSHRHHHHLARLNRLQQSQSNDSESPASSMRSPRTRQYNSWRTHGNRPAQDSESIMSAMADKPQNASMYDLSHGAEADDEFTPLLNRNGRNDPRVRRGRMVSGDSYRPNPMRSCMSCAKYTCISMLMGAVVAFFVIAVVLCNRELFDVHAQVRNVLASEQELFLELAVTARNPNIVDISLSDGNLDLFAKSKYVGTTEMWRDGTIPGIDKLAENDTKAMQFIPNDNVDDGTDPIEEPGSGTHTMLLGKVVELDSSLVFEGSPLNHELRHSSASLRLGKPGNKTEEGGTRRWENVMQHSFELVVRGRLRYYLPLSSKARYMPISASTTVKPDRPIDDDDPKRNDTVRIRERQGSGEVRLRRKWQA